MRRKILRPKLLRAAAGPHDLGPGDREEGSSHPVLADEDTDTWQALLGDDPRTEVVSDVSQVGSRSDYAMTTKRTHQRL